MSNEEILKKAIEKAIKGGWRPPFQDDDVFLGIKGVSLYGLAGFSRKKYQKLTLNKAMRGVVINYHDFIFSHDFAKAFFGKTEYIYAPNGEVCGFKNRGWKEELKNMVISENPIKYLEKFL